MITVFLLCFIKMAAPNIDTLVILVVKNPPANAENAGDVRSVPGVGRSPGGGNGNPVFLPGKSHGQRSLAGYSPWGSKEWT